MEGSSGNAGLGSNPKGAASGRIPRIPRGPRVESHGGLRANPIGVPRSFRDSHLRQPSSLSKPSRPAKPLP
eukprot:scaffold31988_cov67-Phaeocystis_antarctica.AAC.6